MNPGTLDPGYVMAAIAVVGAVTWALRALPFVAAKWIRDHPILKRAQHLIPTAVLVSLLAHAASQGADANPVNPFLDEAAAIALVGALQWTLRQPLLSISAGTGLYMLLRGIQ
jgi:branched-subunit amino acid transport protein AzlD